MIADQLFKVTDDAGAPIHGGNGRWVLGRWWTVKGRLVQCHNGLHFCHAGDLIMWLGPAVWIVEVDQDEEVLATRDSFVARKARVVAKVDTWNERTARLFAADVAERVLPRLGSDDVRPAAAIAGARRAAEGYEVDVWRLARDAGRCANEQREAGNEAGWSVARAAAYSVLESPASVAARGAALLAAEAAAWSGERTDERAWQVGRLVEVLEGGADQ